VFKTEICGKSRALSSFTDTWAAYDEYNNGVCTFLRGNRIAFFCKKLRPIAKIFRRDTRLQREEFTESEVLVSSLFILLRLNEAFEGVDFIDKVGFGCFVLLELFK
jgi:hypothetical protein